MDVSVVIAAKNEAHFIAEAIASILAQRNVSFELIMVDDHSSDRTMTIADGFPDIRLFASPGHGKVAAFNHGVAQARGEWVSLFCGDDVMPPDSLAERWRAVRDVRSDKPVIGLCRLATMCEDRRKNGFVVPRDPRKGAWSGACYMFDRRAVDILFPIPEHLPNEDTWLEVAGQHLDFEIVPSPTIGFRWRIHADNSITPFLPFAEFNRRYTPRMAARDVFVQRWGDSLPADRRAALAATIRCENGRAQGSLFQIMSSGAGVVERLRAAALSGPLLYGIRSRFYGLMSGW